MKGSMRLLTSVSLGWKTKSQKLDLSPAPQKKRAFTSNLAAGGLQLRMSDNPDDPECHLRLII